MPHYDIIVVAGQSNSMLSGMGPSSYTAPYDSRIKRWCDYPSGVQSLSGEQLDHWRRPGLTPAGTGFAINMARCYARDHLGSNRQLLIVPHGRGSTSIRFWDDRAAGRDELLVSLERIFALPGSHLLKAVCWQQGEQDVVDGMDSDEYEDRLLDLIAAVRSEYTTGVRLLIGRMSQAWVPAGTTGPDRKAAIVSAQTRVAQAHDYNKIIPSNAYNGTPALKSNAEAGYSTTDYVHFCAASMMELGERYIHRYGQTVQ